MRSQTSLSGPTLVFLAEALVLPAGLASAILLSRYLGPAEYGWYGLTVSIAVWLEWTVAALFSGAALQLLARAANPEPLANLLLQGNTLAGLVVAAGLCLAAPLLARWFEADILSRSFCTAALLLPLAGATQAHRTLLISKENFGGRAAAAAVRLAVRGAGPVWVVWSGWGVVGAVALLPLAAAVELLICRAFVRPRWFGGREGAHLPLHLISSFFTYSTSQRLWERIDLLSLRGTGIGHYAAAQNLALIPMLLGGSFSGALQTRVAAAVAQQDWALARRHAKLTLSASLLTVPVAVAASLAAPALIATVYGPAFAPAAELVPPLVAGASLACMQTLSNAALNGLGKIRWTMRLSLLQLSATSVALAVLVPQYGVQGAAWIWCLSSAVFAFLSVSLLHRSFAGE